MIYLRLILSAASFAFLIFWSRLVLPLRKQQMPFSGWGDGAAGNAATLAVPVAMFWLATMFALCFICIKPYVRLENRLTRLGRWLTNAALIPVAPILVLYAMHGPPARFFAVYGFAALVCLWLYVDLGVRRNKDEKSNPQKQGSAHSLVSICLVVSFSLYLPTPYDVLLLFDPLADPCLSTADLAELEGFGGPSEEIVIFFERSGRYEVYLCVWKRRNYRGSRLTGA